MRSIIMSSVAFAALSLCAPASAGCTNGSGCYQQVVTPAVYGIQEHTVLVAPARQIAHHVAAQYSTVQETVLVRPARKIAHHIPAQYSTVAETVLVSQATRSWQVSTDAHGRTVGCWVDMPARYATRERTVMVQAASTNYETVPAQTATRARTQLVRPSGVEYETVPAQYRTHSRQVLVQPASASWAPIGGGETRHCGGRGLFGSNCAR